MANFRTTTAKRTCPVCQGTSYCFASDEAVFCRAQVNPAPAGWAVMVRRVAPSGKRYVERVRSVSIEDVDAVVRSKLARRGDNLGPHWLYVLEGKEGAGGGKRITREERAKIRARLEKEDADAIEFARKVWDWAKGGNDHPAVKAYLCGSRGVPVTEHVQARGFGDWIRFASTLKWKDEQGKERRAPGLVCGMVAGRSPLAPESLRAKLTAVQRIYLERDASAGYRKLRAIGDAKMMLGRPYDGGCWISTPDREQGNVLCIGEGVETMAAVFAATGHACVAAMSTTGVRAFSVSDALAARLSAVVYCADHDTLTFDRVTGTVGPRPGISHANIAAGAMRERLARIGWKGVVVVAAPETAEVAGELLSRDVDDKGRNRPYGELEWMEKCRAWADGGKDGERPERPKGIDWLDVCASQASGLGPEAVRRAIEREIEVARVGGVAGGGAGDEGGGDGGGPGGGEGGESGGESGGDDGLRGIGIFDAWEPEVYQPHDDAPRRLVMPEERSLRARMVLTNLFAPKNGWASWGIRYYAGEWFVLGERRGVYVKIAAARLQRLVRAFFEECVKKKVVKGKETYVGVGMSRDAVLDVLEDVAAAVLVESETMPTWVHEDFVDDADGVKRPDFRLRADFDRDACVGPVPADHVLTFPSGILDGRRWVDGADLKLMPASPSWFTSASLPWDLPREAREVARMDDDEANAFVSARCPRWSNQLSAMFDDVEARFVLLQRFFGYMLSAKNGLNKALLIQGLPGTAKGVITHVAGSMVAMKNVAHASLTMLGRPFGAGMLVGAPLISMSEFRMGRSSDEALAYERMLKAISDEFVDVEDKHLRQIRQVRIAGKWLITPNEDPRIRDESGAFVERLRAIYLTRVFRNTEGEVAGLKYRIVEEELPWIGLWAMIGYRQVERMLAAGRAPKLILPQPAQDAGLLHEMQSTARLVGSFADEVCVREPGSCVAQRVLYEQHFKPWAIEQGGKASEMYINSFTSRLLAATGIPLPDDFKTPDGRAVRVYRGIRPRMPWEVGKQLDKPERIAVLEWTHGPWPYKEKVTHYGRQHDLPT